MRPRRGFTLWEIAIVLMVMAVAAGLAVPAFARLGEEPERTSADVMLALLRDARAVAITHHAVVSVTVDPETGHFRVDSITRSGRGIVAQDTLAIDFAERLETELPRLRYLFRPTGAAFGDTVRLMGRDGPVAIHVDPWSGVARAEPR